MATRHQTDTDLHGSAPDSHPAALLLIDVINPFDFPEAEQLLASALPASERIAALAARAREAGVPVVYVNDNFGRWRSDFRQVVEACEAEGSRGREVVRRLRPQEQDYFVLKPKHTGFYASALELLLRKLRTRQLVLTGFAGNICVLFTANDAYMRDLQLFVPEDCCASNTAHDNAHALAQMRTLLKAETAPAGQLAFSAEGVQRQSPSPSGRAPPSPSGRGSG
jgi:nicotinamidase-related amidase